MVTPSDFRGPMGSDLPDLHDAIVVAAFEGWNDAGDAASDALQHLDSIWQAEPIVHIDDESYYDYQVNRPVIRQVDGVTRELVWPSMRISHCRPPGSDRDIVLMHGVEPNMRWRTFCAELLAIADKLNVQTVVILGALLADTPHTRPVPVSGAAYSSDSAKLFGLEETRYEGPTGIAGVFQDACVQAGIPAVTFWAAVPHYVSQPPNPKATVALLRRVEDVLDVEVPLADLPAQAEDWEQAVTEMTSEDDEIAERIRTLGAPAPGTYKAFAELTGIPEDEEAPDARGMIENLVRGRETIVRRARELVPQVQEAGDEPTADLLIQRMQVHEKDAWMLRSLLE